MPEIDSSVDNAAAVASETTVVDGADSTPSDQSVTEPDADPPPPRRRIDRTRALRYLLLPGLVITLAAGAGYLQWRELSARAADNSRIEAVAAAKEAAVALLSYKFDTVEKDLGAARDRLTGPFQDSYSQLTRNDVIPAAKQRHISAEATVLAASTVSASADHAVVLLFVNQTVRAEKAPPTDTASSVKVTLEKTGDRWLVSAFDPV